MKDLYKPVFWCGFALSLSALYFSSEQAASGSDGESRKPVLLQISFGEAHQVLRTDRAPIESTSPPLSVPSAPQPVITEDPFEVEPAPISTPAPGGGSAKTSAFFSAAQKAIGGP